MNTNAISINSCSTCLAFIHIRKNNDVSWYGTYALLRGLDGTSMIINRSYEAKSKNHTRLLILRKALIRLRELGINSFACFDQRNKWKNLYCGKVKIH